MNILDRVFSQVREEETVDPIDIENLLYAEFDSEFYFEADDEWNTLE